jgi:serine/threonine protein phosphatase PrpC
MIFMMLDPMKANQDKYGITLNFAGEDGDAMFAVYDGHGSEGHDCAAYSKKKLPQSLAKYVRQKRVQKYMAKLKAEGKPTKGAWNPKQWPLLGSEEYETCCRKAFHEANQALHDEKSVSGTDDGPFRKIGDVGF